MAPSGRGAVKARTAASSADKKKSRADDGSLPEPFRRMPDSLEPFVKVLSPEHVYIAHIDTKPAASKRKFFLVPVALNLFVVIFFVWRVSYIGPHYLQLLGSALGQETETTVDASAMTYKQLIRVILRRAFTMALDFALAVFVWPWPVEFCFGRSHGNPVAWRWAVGFRDKEIYVRRSREWDRLLFGKEDVDVLKSSDAKTLLFSYVRSATNPLYLGEKTGYLTMNGEWDLDWAAMVHAHRLVDKKDMALDAFRVVVFLHHEDHGWIVVNTAPAQSSSGNSSNASGGATNVDDDRRRQIFAFRDALAAMGKDKLFYRWIEIIQFETTQPGGFTQEKQVAAAKQIRDLFQSEGVDFDNVWKESVGTDSLPGMG